MAKHRLQDEAPKGYKGSHRKGGGEFKHPGVRRQGSDVRQARDLIQRVEREEQDRR